MITNEQALLALGSGKDVEVRMLIGGKIWGRWVNIKDIKEYKLKDILINPHGDQFRLKPSTITINGIEVPAPFEPKVGDTAYFLSSTFKGYQYTTNYTKHHAKNPYGSWRTEEEIKQVVEALRSIFNG